MYIRTKTSPLSPRKSIQIVEGIRTGDKVKQKILRHVGVAADEKEKEKLNKLAIEIMNKMSVDVDSQTTKRTQRIRIKKQGRKSQRRIEDIIPVNEVRLNDIIEEKRIVEGPHEVGKVIYDELGYTDILSKREGKILEDMILSRLAFPTSKHRSQKILANQFGKEHSLDGIYRMMDKLYDRIDVVKRCTFERLRNLFPSKMNLVLFDVTTLYFETVEVDELRNFGYSKDCRFNTVQVVLALATNEDGLPISYELFEGNKAEVKTLVGAIEKWRKLFDIGSVCFVGDRAMFTKENLSLLKNLGYTYVIAAKLRGMTQEEQQEILNEENYNPTVIKDQLAWIGEFEHKENRLIVSYKSKRAMNDKKERQRQIEKIIKTIGTKGPTRKLLTNQAIKKFTKTDVNSKTTLDDEQIVNDELWDGLHGVITNIRDDKPQAILARYAQLWLIEESFRINKHLLKIRPIFHWKVKRIHTHIAMCYMSFAVLRHLQYRITLTKKISPENIVQELLQIQSSIHIHKETGDRYRIPGSFTNTARKIYKTFNLQRQLNATIYLG